MAGMSLRSGTRLPGEEISREKEEDRAAEKASAGPAEPEAEEEENRGVPSNPEQGDRRSRDDETRREDEFAMRADRPLRGDRRSPRKILGGASSAEVTTPKARSSNWRVPGEEGSSGAEIGEGSAGRASRRTLGEEGSRYRYTSLPKVEVPARFTGDQESGPRLKTYAMHVRSEKYCWELDGLDLRHFFRSLGNTLAGEAEAFFLEIRDLLLEEEERDKLGRVRRDAEGRVIRLEDPTERFLEELQTHFPTQTPARLREFEQVRRGHRESLLAYYRRVKQLAEDISCHDPRIVVAKFLDGLSRELARTVRDRTYDLGPNATLRQAYEIAWRHEQSLSLYDLGRRTDRGPRDKERRPVTWSGALLAEEEEEEPDKERVRRGQVRRVRNSIAAAGEEPVCYKCREPGHFKRDCPKVQTCSYCQRRGHNKETCYTRQREERHKGGRRSRIAALEEELRKLKAEEVSSGEEEETTGLMARGQSESEDDMEEPIFMAKDAERTREELGLRSGGRDNRSSTPIARRGPRASVQRSVERAEEVVTAATAAGEVGPRRHPFERLAARPCVVEALEGTVAMEGKYPGTTIIDTGASQVLVGRRMAERLGLHQEDKVTREGVRIQTAEGGGGKWLPRSLKPQEVVLSPGTEDETRIRVHCLISDSEDYDLLLGMELLYKVGAVVDTWTEKVTYQPLYWDPEVRKEEQRAVSLPARFLRGKAAYQEPSPERVPEWNYEDCGVFMEKAKQRKELEEAAGERVGELREARGLAEPTYDFETFNKPVTLLELFGGIGPGLAATVRTGLTVKRWVYIEKEAEKRRMAYHHARMLHQQYPERLPLAVIERTEVEAEGLAEVEMVDEGVVERWGDIDLMVAGWECQGLSRAGQGRGMTDARTGLFQEMIRIMKLIKRRQGPFAYIVENLDVAEDERALVREAHKAVTRELGHGVAWDAAQMGARAHRVRRYWQNLVPEPVLRDQLGRMQRPMPRLVQEILEPGRRPAPVTTPDCKLQYPCNEVGAPRQAWPTLVASPRSYAFRKEGDQPGPGMVQVIETGEWEEPLAVERERAMGYLRNATAAEGVSEEARRRALGGAIDQHALVWLLYRAEKRQEVMRAQLLMHWRWADIMEMSEGEPEKAMELAAEWRRMRADQLARGEWQEGMLNSRGIHLLAKQPESNQAEGTAEREERAKTASKGEGCERETGDVATWTIGEALNQEQKERLRRVLAKAKGAFAYSLKELGKCNRAEMEIELQTEMPVYQRRRRMSPGDRDVATEKCQELLEAGLIRESTSEYAAATVVAARKDLTGETLARRMCGDYRGLNQVTKSDRYPMPITEEIFDKLAKGRVYSTLDLRQGFNQIPIKEEDKKKTAFHGPDRLYEWNYMPFGLKNASAKFQRVMDQVLQGVTCALCYIDDVVIYSEDAERHIQDVADTLAAIQTAGLTCHPGKCTFGVTTVAYLGFQVGEGGLSVQQAKVEVVDRLRAPTDRSTLRAQLGFLSYYRKFIPNFSKTARPLNMLLREDQGWTWGEEQEGAWRVLKEAVKTAPMLKLPDPEEPFTLYTDWSSSGLGAVLCQKERGTERVVAYASRSCSPAESNYSSYEGEGLAAVWAVELFRAYLQGRKFTLVTDHQPLLWLMKNQTLKGRNARWAMRLQEFEFEVKHRPGKTLQHVDGLSRQGAEERKENQRSSEAGLACLAVAAEREGWRRRPEAEKGNKEIWLDEPVLRWVKGLGAEGEEVPERVRARGIHYRWQDDQLQLLTEDGWRIVPKPEERQELIQKVHTRLGHFAVERTVQLLQTMYWWVGLRREVKERLEKCEPCSRNRATMEKARAELHSLPIGGIGYRWSLDIAGELPLSRRGKQYILVMIEHTSKWVEVATLMRKSAAAVAEAFVQQVLTRFGACGEVLTDQGSEFAGEFDKMLKEVGITHRRTSRYHPQSDGLTERMVQTIKRGLRKYCEEEEKRDWDVKLPWVVVGYRFSKQQALKDYSPYYLLFGKEPILPVDAPRIMVESMSGEDPAKWAAVAAARASYLRTAMPAALENLEVAQIRDARRYRQRRMEVGAIAKGARVVKVGDEVYLRQQRRDTLECGLSRERWKVRSRKDSGVVILEGGTGRVIQDHISNVAKAGSSRHASGDARQAVRGQESTVQPVITYQRRKDKRMRDRPEASAGY